jgi:hypothetical protein
MDIEKTKKIRNKVRWGAIGCVFIILSFLLLPAFCCTVGLPFRIYDNYKYGPDIITYALNIKPGMTEDDVKSLFPENTHTDAKSVDQYDMTLVRRFSNNREVNARTFSSHKNADIPITIYFDKNGIIVGIDYSSSGAGKRLMNNELRFPTEKQKEEIHNKTNPLDVVPPPEI